MRAPGLGRLVVVAGLALLGGCDGEPDPGTGAGAVTGPTGATVSSAPGPGPVWLAAFRVEADSNALNADTQAIMDLAGPAIFAGPIACFEGFPPEFVPSPDAYVLGVIAPTRAEVDQVVERVGLTPIFVERLPNVCVD